MMTGETPFAQPHLTNIDSNIRTKPLPTIYSQELRELVDKILIKGKDNTPTIE
jgi:hypothetical protein